MAGTSKSWPYIRAIAKALKVPGTEIGPSLFTDLKDQLDAAEHQQRVDEALEELKRKTDTILAILREEEVEDPGALGRVAEVFYLEQVALEYLYADFKGIAQSRPPVPLKLDDIFVNLKAVPEQIVAERHVREQELIDRLEEAEHAERQAVEAELAEMEADRLQEPRTEERAEPVCRIISDRGRVVILGGPGTGKTTLVKRLARSCALGPRELEARFPELAWRFPVVIPIALFAEEARGGDLQGHVECKMEQRGGKTLADRFREYWSDGQCLLLLDGLDEVVQEGLRTVCARSVELVVQQAGRNAVVTTSRIVGYNICRLDVPVAHFVLQNFDRQDVETFVLCWERAFELSVHPEAPDLKKAEDEARDVIRELRSRSQVESLATNPLMLTILAIIKHQKVKLPERRVELYEAAVNTLIESWNEARSLAPTVPIGEDLGPEATKSVWAAVAFWMHEHKGHGTCRRRDLYETLCRRLAEDGCDGLQAAQTAESYLAAATRTSGLLEERGHNIFAFVHQTLQEYLAAYHLCRDPMTAIDEISRLAPDPRWHEVILLSAGCFGSVIGQVSMSTRLVGKLMDDDAPLERVLCRSLRLAAACVADNVRLKPHTAEKVLCRLFHRVLTVPYGSVQSALLERLEVLKTRPARADIPLLVEAAKHRESRVRMEAARCLARVADTSPPAKECLEQLFEKGRNADVRACAAVGLWRGGTRGETLAIWAMARPARSAATMSVIPETGLASEAVKLLKSEDSGVRRCAADALGRWGYQESAAPALMKLLEDEDSGVRRCAAEALGRWGYQESAAPALMKLLEDEDSGVRCCAAEALGRWEHQESVPALVKLLADEDSRVRYGAAAALGRLGRQESAVPALAKLLKPEGSSAWAFAAFVLVRWGYQELVVPALIKLLGDGDSRMRHLAAEALGECGPQESAVPALVKLLADEDSGVRCRAANLLGNWGHQESAAPVLVKLLEDEDLAVRGLAKALRKWEPQESVVPALVKLLESEDPDVRCSVASVLGRWGPQESALPALMERLVDKEYSVRSSTVEALGDWGPQGAVVPVLVKLLGISALAIRDSAASVLAKWGAGAAGPTVLSRLIPGREAGVLAFLSRDPDQRVTSPSPTVAEALIEAISHREGDSAETSSKRRIVFKWLWAATEGKASCGSVSLERFLDGLQGPDGGWLLGH